MKRRVKKCQVFAILIASILTLSSCGVNENEDATLKEIMPSSIEEVDLNLLVTEVGNWCDNSLDFYSAIGKHELMISEPKDAESGGGISLFVGNSCGIRFKKHLFSELNTNWDEMVYVTKDGTSKAMPIEIGEQVWCMGAVAGADDCLMETIIWQEEGYAEHHVIVADKTVARKKDIHLAFLDGADYIIFDDMRMDISGNLHMVYEDEVKHYAITDSQGRLLCNYIIEGSLEHLYWLRDGQVALKIQEKVKKNQKYYFLQYDLKNSKMTSLAEIEKASSSHVLEAVCLDADTIFFADSKGIYKGTPNDIQNATLLYEWVKHGMQITDIWDMQCLERDRISMICEEGDRIYYLNLEPTKEEVPIQTITFAIPEYKLSDYQKTAVAFNKKYPTYYIELVTGYDQTALLTEIIAGKGPVLIDTSLIAFEEQKELWVPLDKILEKLGLTDQLLLSAMEFGNIDGQLYGIVKDFSIRTVVTVGNNARNWNYEELAKEILENQKLEALTDNIVCDKGEIFINQFFVHGLEDNFFIDTKTRTTRFKESQMRDMFETTKEFYSRIEGYELGKRLEEGKMLCKPVDISRPEQLALLRLYFGEQLHYSGYPTKNGGRHFLHGSNPITIRKTASKEEITGACLFFQMLLSYEVQKEALTNHNISFSVRKDVLEEQLASVNEESYADMIGFEQIQLGDGVDYEKDKETFYNLLENASPERYLPKGLSDIFTEELTQYFGGEISVDTMLEHLENRVQLYLDEN